MTLETRSPEARRSLIQGIVSLLILVVISSLVWAAPAAAAEPAPVLDGEASFGSGSLDWGFAESWRCEVVGLIGGGTIEATEGATKIAGSEASGAACALDPSGSEAIRFPVIGDYFDPETESLGIQTSGAVRFAGSSGPIPGAGTPFDFTVRDIYVTAEGDEGTLLADVAGTSPGSSEPVSYEDISLVAMDFSGVTPSERAGGIDWNAVPTTLTEEGAGVFSSSLEDDPFDPVTIAADFGEFDGEPDPEPVKPGRIESVGATRARGGVAKVARVFCLGGESPCGLIAPGRVGIKAGGKSTSVRVKAPFKVGAGQRAFVKLVLGKSGKRLLKSAGRAKGKLRLTVTRDGEAVSRTVRIALRG